MLQLTLLPPAPDPALVDAVGAYLLRPRRMRGLDLHGLLHWAILNGLLHRIPSGPLAGRLVVGPGRWPKLKEFGAGGRMLTRRPPKNQAAYYLLPSHGTRDVRVAGPRPVAEALIEEQLALAQGMPPVRELPRPPAHIYTAYAPKLNPAARELLLLHFPDRRLVHELERIENVFRLTGEALPDVCAYPVRRLIVDETGTRREWRPCGLPVEHDGYCRKHAPWAETRARTQAAHPHAEASPVPHTASDVQAHTAREEIRNGSR